MLTKMARGTESLKVFHTHDCEECVFLGHMKGYSGKWMDVWYHAGKHEDELMLRFGQDGDYLSYDLSHSWEDQLPKDHPYNPATELYRNWIAAGSTWNIVDVIPQDVRNSDEMEWEEGYLTVVGLYRDIKVKKTERNIFIRDYHGNPLGIAKILKDPATGLVRTYRFEPYEDLPLEGLPMRKDFASTNAVFLYAMTLDQEMVDGGH